MAKYDEETGTITVRGWTFYPDEMVAECKHGWRTEVDGTTPCCGVAPLAEVC